MKPRTAYDLKFYTSKCAGSLLSARVVVPLVVSLLKPRSVVDVGCGLGTWLRAFRENGVDNILGLDGDHIDQSRLLIPKECFQPTELSQPFALDREFDLAVSVEVAEHLPARSAEVFIQSLVRLAPAILFSAAVPLQGGTHHVNEQWPDYWCALFGQHKYRLLDVLRNQIWKDKRVEWWYRQNLFVYVDETFLNSELEFAKEMTGSEELLLLHTDILRRHLGLRASLKRVPRLVWKSLTTRLRAPFRVDTW